MGVLYQGKWNYAEYLVRTFTQPHNSIHYARNSLKNGYYSTQIKIVQWVCRVYAQESPSFLVYFVFSFSTFKPNNSFLSFFFCLFVLRIIPSARAIEKKRKHLIIVSKCLASKRTFYECSQIYISICPSWHTKTKCRQSFERGFGHPRNETPKKMRTVSLW